jgi:hypothetical protein
VAVAVSRTTIEETGTPESVTSLTDGLRAAFAVSAVFAVFGLLVAVFVLKRGTGVEQEETAEPEPARSAG